MMVVLLAAAGLIGVGIGLVPIASARLDSAADRIAVAATLMLTAWPISWTFLFGPILFGGTVPSVYPLIWYGPAVLMSFIALVWNVNQGTLTIDLGSVLLASVSFLTLCSVVFTPKNASDIVRWALAAMLLSVTLLKSQGVSPRAVATGCRYSLALVTASILLAVLVNPTVVTECRFDKCGIAGQVLTSPFAGNGNILGLYLALMLPFAIFRASLGAAVCAVIGVIAVCELAGSRTALIGVVVAAGLYVALLFAGTDRARRFVLYGTLGTITAATLLPAVMVYGDEAYTFRGSLWNQAKRFIAEHSAFGSGPTAWEKYGLTSIQDANYSPHNIWLDMTVSVGIVGTLMLVAAVAVKIATADSEAREYLVFYFCSVLGAAGLESVFVPYFIGITPFVAILPFLIGGPRSASATDDAEPPSPQRTTHPFPSRRRASKREITPKSWI